MGYGIEIREKGQVFYTSDNDLGEFFLVLDSFAVSNNTSYSKSYAGTELSGARLKAIRLGGSTHSISCGAAGVTATSTSSAGGGWIVVLAS